MKIQARCVECGWKGDIYRRGMTYKGAVREGVVHHAVTGHAVKVPTLARRKQHVIEHVDQA